MKNLAISQKQARLPTALFKYVVTHGLSAPSGDNCQPFLFENADSGVIILHDNVRGKHTLNGNGIGSSIALGCTIESISIAMSQRGYQTSCRIFDRYNSAVAATEPVAHLEFSEGNITPDPLFSSLEQRYTDRRPYLGGTIEESLLAKLLNERPAKLMADCRISFCGQPSETFVNSVSWLDRAVWVHETAHQDLMSWLRLTDAAVETTDDGMPWTTLGAKQHELFALRLNRRWRVQQCANLVGAPGMMQQLARKLINSSAGLFLLSSEHRSFASEVDVGRTALRLWVSLNAKGFSVQPVSLAPFMAYLSSIGKKPDFKQPYLDHIETLPSLFRQEFRLEGKETPIWMFRAGLPQPVGVLNQHLRTKRRVWTKAVFDSENR